MIFDNYTYSPAALQWASQDFGKLNCSKANPRHASLDARVVKMWNRQVMSHALMQSEASAQCSM